MASKRKQLEQSTGCRSKFAKEIQEKPPYATLEYPRGEHYARQWAALSAWFLGPKAENMELFKDLVMKSFDGHAAFRREYYPTDGDYITNSIKETNEYRHETRQMREELDKMIQELKNSLPITSIRFEGHMNWDTTMPANLGYLAAILYNANNVANEASPVTTKYEIDAGQELCKMLGFEFSESKPGPWGHITADGSIANIEAMWSCRNVKFYPLCVQKALQEDDALKSAKEYKIYVPRLGKTKKMVNVATWDMLNLDIDDIIKIPDEVIKMANVTKATYSQEVDKYSLANLGWYDFMKIHGLTKQPVAMASMAMHYSWPKAATLLGMGQCNMIGVEYDKNARMDINALKLKLLHCLRSQIPVISIVAVIGTTEESAVDPLEEIVSLRSEFKKKGLYFAINADAAWGGYFMTMLHPLKNEKTLLMSDIRDSEIPSFPLSEYTTRQLLNMKYADTITVDPHKSGYCPYPAGGLCYRNGIMKNFVKIEADVVYHEGDDPSVGIWGVEGSKPGAAPAGVILSHKVIGLDRFGYGRILGQCTYGGKLFYCLWLTLAKEEDNFICIPMKPLPDEISPDYAVEMIKKHIENKDNHAIQQDKNAMDFLSKIGPDTVINAFAVNKKGNGDLDLCNRITFEVFRKLSHTNTKQNIQRIPLILTHSSLHPMKFGEAVKQFKDRLGLPGDTEGKLDFLINTVMNPWVAENDKVKKIGTAFRQTVLNVIGKITDKASIHGFVCSGMISDSGDVFGDHIPMFDMPEHQYHAIAKFNVRNIKDIKRIQQKHVEQSRIPTANRQPIIFGNKKVFVLEDFLETSMEKEQEVEFFVGLPSDVNKPFLTTKVKVLDIPRCKHFDLTVKSYPERMSYFLYGVNDEVYLSHNLSMKPDFFQVVKLNKKPRDVPDLLIDIGIDVTFPTLDGKPPMNNNAKMKDPLELKNYPIAFTSIGGLSAESTVDLSNADAKVWFDEIIY